MALLGAEALMPEGKHRRQFERRSAGDPGIIGKKVYHPDNQLLIGIPQLKSPHPDGGWVVIVRVPDRENPVHLRLYEVLIEVAPHLNIYEEPIEPTTEGLDTRDVSLLPVDSPSRQKLRERAAAEGAEDLTREPGISDDEAEPELPHEGNGVDYSKVPRLAGPLVDPITGETRPEDDGTMYPAGGGLGRGRDKGNRGHEEEGSHREGPTTGGGTSMASVGEVKSAIDAANHQVAEAQAMLRAAIEKLGEVGQSYALAFEGSGHDSVATAQNAVSHVRDSLEENIQSLSAGIEAAGQYAANL